MLKVFKQNGNGQILFLFVAVALLWTKGFISPPAPQMQDGFAPLYELCYNWLHPYPYIATIGALLLTLVEGVWLCVMLYNNKMLPSSTFLPVLFYFIAMSYHHGALTLTPMLMCNFFILLGIQQLLRGESKNLPPERIFNTTLSIGMATLFYMPAVTLLLPFLVVVTIYQLYRWRDWVVMLLGFIAPYIVLGTYYYMTDYVDYMLYLMGNDIAHLQFTWHHTTPLHTIADISIMTLIVWCLLSRIGTGQEGTTDFRRQSAIVLMPILGSILMLFFDACFPLNTQLFAIPFTFAATMYFLSVKRRFWLCDVIIISIVIFGALWF
jgi:hypothetical protein